LCYNRMLNDGVVPSAGFEPADPRFELGASARWASSAKLGAEDSNPYDGGQNPAACPVSRAPNGTVDGSRTRYFTLEE
jgi:hypothetical protein